MSQTVMASLTGIGGLCLFLYGILLLSDGMREASGRWFRDMMALISRKRLRGYLLGVSMGAAVQSSASTVMAVGLINAGLLTLGGAIPLIAGANFGTTLSMQFISLEIGWLWPALALLGLPLRVLPGDFRRRRVGQALIGLSLLVLGMQLMSQSLHPFREILSGWLTHDPAGDWDTFLVSLAGSMAFTAIVQSSGATIGILFSLSSSGVLTDIGQAYPLILGAHIGTCITALLGSIGTSADARRGAIAHLYFNLFTSALAIMAMPWIIEGVAALGGTLIRQVANAHSLVMIIGGLVVTPATGIMLALVRHTTSFRRERQDTSFLDMNLLGDPSAALDACDRELARITRIVRRGFALNRRLMASPCSSTYHAVKQTEDMVDLIRNAMRRYLVRLAENVTEGADADRLQWNNLFLVYLERISDHNENLADLSRDLHDNVTGDDLAYARPTCDKLYAASEPLLKTLEDLWTAGSEGRREYVGQIHAFRSHYLLESENLHTEIVGRISGRQLGAVAGFFMTEYVTEIDRIVRHTKKIAGLLERVSQKHV